MEKISFFLQQKNLPTWFNNFIEELELIEIGSIVAVLFLISLLILIPFSVLGLFFGFSWLSFLATITLLTMMISCVILVACVIDNLETINPVELWIRYFWTEVDFTNSAIPIYQIEEWSKENCRGFCKKSKYWKRILFSRKSDAVHAKLKWM